MSRSRIRAHRGLLIVTAVALVLTACASGPAGPLATVDGEEIPREQVAGWVRTATDANPAIDPVGLQIDLLSTTILVRIFEGIIEERGSSVDPASFEAMRAFITGQVGGELALEARLVEIGFPDDYFEGVFLRTQMILDTLATELSEGRTLETRTARHILVNTVEEADEIYALLLDGADFAQLAQDRSEDTGSGPQGGMLPPSERGTFVEPFDDAVWAAELSTVLEPVESEYGFHVIEVLEAVTLTAAELDPGTRWNLVADLLNPILAAAIASADVIVDPTIGTWDAAGGSVLPVGAAN